MDILGETMVMQFNPTIILEEILKIPLVIVLVLTFLYSSLLLFRVKILLDTVQAEGNSKMKALSYLNLLISIVITIMGSIIIVLL
jgi:hypothetical protein